MVDVVVLSDVVELPLGAAADVSVLLLVVLLEVLVELLGGLTTTVDGFGAGGATTVVVELAGAGATVRST